MVERKRAQKLTAKEWDVYCRIWAYGVNNGCEDDIWGSEELDTVNSVTKKFDRLCPSEKEMNQFKKPTRAEPTPKTRG